MVHKSTAFNKLFKKILYLILLTIVYPEYGKNIVQYDEFDWYFLQTEHFDVYFSGEGEKNADLVAAYSEEAYDKISRLIGWDLKKRSSIIFYNSHNDFQQTNVVNLYLREGIGGVTELMKNRMVIPYDGLLKDFKHVIFHELVHVFINDGMYGGSIQNLINSSTVMIPKWMNEGLAEYLANRWDVNSDMWMRDLAINSTVLPDLRTLNNGLLAYRGGQSIWKFITEKWGEESIAEIFYNVKLKKNINDGFESAIGVDLEELTNQWHKYVKKEYWPDIAIRDDIQDMARQITNHEELNNQYNVSPAPSPDGTQVAMYSNRDGEMAIYIISMTDGKFIKRIVTANKTAKFEELHFLKPGISWSNDNERIVFSAKSGSTDALVIFNINDKKDFLTIKFNLEGIFAPSWNPQNNLIAFIGNNGYASDIYVYDLDTDNLLNLTDDRFTDKQIKWHPNGKELIFVSDRGNYLNSNQNIDVDILLGHNIENDDLYTIDLNGKIDRLTASNYNEQYPAYSLDGTNIAYVSDRSGINNIYLSNDKCKTSRPATNVLTDISQISWVTNNQIIFTGFYKTGYDIFIASNIKRMQNEINVIPVSKWRELAPVKLLRKSDSYNPSEEKEVSDFIFSSDNLRTQGTNTIIKTQPKSNLGNYHKYKYVTRFTLDFAQASYVYDSYYGSQAMALFMFSDILGDHRVGLSVEMQNNISLTDLIFEYRFLKNKMNHIGQFYHRAHQAIFDNYSYNIYKNIGIDYRLTYPFSRFSRLEGGLNFNYYIKRYYNSDDIFLPNNINSSPDKKIALPYAKYVFDNTRRFYLYAVSGTRLYLKYDAAPNISINDYSFHRLTFDSRSYFELSYTGKVSFAARFYGGTSWGDDARKFALGGTPWVASSDIDLISDDYEDNLGEHYYMNNFVYPIRGHELGQRYGNHALLMNFEFRLPMLVYYFPTIKYLGQIFGVFFVDMGVAWDDHFPAYNDRDSWCNPKKTNSSGLGTYDECDGMTTGWIMSYGFGPRFIFFNMPWKLDYAWEYDPNLGKISDKKWYLSVGLDF